LSGSSSTALLLLPLLLLLLLCVLAFTQVGFLLKPFGFFESNPALDVPPEDVKHSSSSSSNNSSSSCCAAAPGAAGAGVQGVQVVTSNIRSKL
jgi:hypothetical protein